MRNSYVISVVAVIAAFSIISCKSANRAASNAAAEWKDIVAWKGDVSLNQKVLPAPLPDSASFAGERVPLNYRDVRVVSFVLFSGLLFWEGVSTVGAREGGEK